MMRVWRFYEGMKPDISKARGPGAGLGFGSGKRQKVGKEKGGRPGFGANAFAKSGLN